MLVLKCLLKIVLTIPDFAYKMGLILYNELINEFIIFTIRKCC